MSAVTPLPRSTSDALADSARKLFLIDEQMYCLSGDQLEFMKAQTGIVDDEELKQHIISIQRKAYEVYPYPCIRRYSFIEFALSTLPAYGQVLKLGKEREGAILLDVGCCLGNDIRHIAADGFPAKQIIGTDLRGDYWPLGHELFRSTKESFPASFVAGDIFDPTHLTVVPPAHGEVPGTAPELSTLKSLNPLHGRVSIIHASAFFHLLDEEQQAHSARALAGLLSPEPGSVILGLHAGAAHKHLQSYKVGPEAIEVKMFFHSPESWTQLWDGEVFEKGTVEVDAKLVEEKRLGGDGKPAVFLYWSVMRL